MNQAVRILLCLVVATVIIIVYYSINENVLGQQEQQPTNYTDNLETMIQQNDRIIEQNDETAIQDRAGTYIGTIALLVSLSLVIYGFQLSHGGKITQKAKRHYQIIVLSLIVPVFILLTVASLAWGIHNKFLYPHYNIMASLLLIPALLVIILMFKGSIVGGDQPTDSANTKNEQ
jgi:ABC-type spermidine/putrescine transport system permease subunit I